MYTQEKIFSFRCSIICHNLFGLEFGCVSGLYIKLSLKYIQRFNKVKRLYDNFCGKIFAEKFLRNFCSHIFFKPVPFDHRLNYNTLQNLKSKKHYDFIIICQFSLFKREIFFKIPLPILYSKKIQIMLYYPLTTTIIK